LAAVAHRSGLSPAYISQIESAQANPTITTLVRVAAALDLTPEDLLGGVTDDRARATPEFEARVTTVPQAAVSALGHGIWDLTANGSSLLVSRLVRGPAGDHSQPITHSGEEFLTVLAGRCRVTVGGLTRELGRFDSCHLAASQIHQISDVSDDLLLLVVLTEE
jgi:transcriptional regulator with XRE-family HTH domain